MQKIKLITTDMILKRIFLSLIAMVCLQSASAQQLQASQSHFSTENGMSSNAIAGIYQDDYGFLWVATWNGLSRYDGYNFYNYRTGNGSRIKNLHNRIYDLAIDQSQNIWMRMYDYRVFVLNRSIDKIINPFEGINGYEKFKANSPILVTSTGDVLVSIKDVGLYIIRLTRRGFQREQITTGGLSVTSMAEGYQNDIWLGTEKGVHRLDRSNLSLESHSFLDNEDVSCMYSNGYKIYAGCKDGAIYSFAYGQEPKCHRKATGSPILSLFVDSGDLIWFNDTRMGSARIKPDTGNEKLFQQSVPVPEYYDFGGGFSEKYGKVWVRMNHGGYGYYNRETDNVEYFHNDPSNPWNLSNTVLASLETQEGVIWMSTIRRGLDKLEILNNNIVRKLPVKEAQSTLENEIRSIYYDPQRELTFIGNKANTLFIYDKEWNETTIKADSQGNPLGRIYNVFKDSKGNYWISSKGKGLFKMSSQGAGWSIVRYCHDPNNQYSLGSDDVYETVEDRNGNIWIATYGSGVNLLTKDKSGKEVFLHSGNSMKKYPKDAYHKVRCIEMDKDGNIWGGSTDGIIVFSYKNGKINIGPMENAESEDHILMSTDIVCLRRDEGGRMWVGTNGGGLSRSLSKDSKDNWLFETFGAKDGLPSEEIRSITIDPRGYIWFGTDHVICSYDPDKGIFSTFSSLDGVDDTMLSEAAAAAVGTDNVLFGTLNGYYIVDRKKLMASTGSLLKLHITDFFLNDELQSPRFNSNFDDYPPECKTIEIPTRNASFAFRFASLNFQLQHRVHYQYMLEGYDKDWKNAGKDRIASYSDVPGGTYRLKIKAFLLESPEKYDMRTIEIVVPDSILLSPVALAIYFVIILILAILIYVKRKSMPIVKKQQVEENNQSAISESQE